MINSEKEKTILNYLKELKCKVIIKIMNDNKYQVKNNSNKKQNKLDN